MSKKLICLVSFALVLGMTVSVADADVTTGLVSHWKLDETSGTTARDSAGNNDGTLIGDATWMEGWIGGAVEFDGEGDYVDCGNSDTFDIRDAVTLSAWVKPDPDFLYPDWSGIIHKGSVVDYDTFAFYYKGPTKELGFKTGDTAPDTWYPIPAAGLFDRTWHHVAAVYDGTTKSIYLDGEVVGATGSTGRIRTSNGRCLLGAGRDYNPPTHYFVGKLDDARIYRRALTREEIQQVMTGAGIPPALAFNPFPPDCATNVPQEVTLTWRPGAYVEGLSPKHRLFFSENFDDVNDSIGGIEQDVARYPVDGSLKFDLGKTCYWRVDEANSTTGWDLGALWQFTIADYLVVDDFESYYDLCPLEAGGCNRIFNTWIDGWEVPKNGAIVGYENPPFAEQTIVHGGNQSMPLFYDNSGTATYSQAQRTFNPVQDWTREGVGVLSLWFRGHPAYVGSFVEAPASTYTMTGSGTDIWAKSDEFHFAYKELSGAAAIIAKVESVENTDPWAKAGVMIRDTLDADSRYAGVLVTPENGVRFQYRKTAGSRTERNFAEGITAPQWVKLERTTGGLVRAFYSADDSTWTLLNMTVVSMDMPVFIGLVVTSHNRDLTCEAKFSSVSFGNTSVGPQWADQDVGMLSNEAQPMYVTVRDGSGKAVTVYHDDPNATLIDTWTQWNIDTKEFGDAGVVLTDVDKMAIGFGGVDNPQPGGSGLVFFDDIRLYLPAP
jgi:hypothetical protein